MAWDKIIKGIGDVMGIANPLIGVGANILGGLLGKSGQDDTNAMNYKINQENNAFNADEAQKARDFNYMMFEKSNEWNSEGAQLERMRAAGINPLSQSFQGSTATPLQGAAASSSPSIAMQNPMAAMSQALQNTPHALAETELLKAQADKLKSETNVNNSQSSVNTETQKALELSNKFTKATLTARTITELSRLYYEDVTNRNNTSIASIYAEQLRNGTVDDKIAEAFSAQFESVSTNLIRQNQEITNMIKQGKLIDQEINASISATLLGWATYVQTGEIALAQQAVEKYCSDNALKGQLASAEAVVEASKHALEGQIISSENHVKAAAIGAEAQKYSSDRSYEATKYASDNSYYGTRYSAQMSLKGQKYTADKHYEGMLSIATMQGVGQMFQFGDKKGWLDKKPKDVLRDLIKRTPKPMPINR